MKELTSEQQDFMKNLGECYKTIMKYLIVSEEFRENFRKDPVRTLKEVGVTISSKEIEGKLQKMVPESFVDLRPSGTAWNMPVVDVFVVAGVLIRVNSNDRLIESSELTRILSGEDISRVMDTMQIDSVKLKAASKDIQLEERIKALEDKIH